MSIINCMRGLFSSTSIHLTITLVIIPAERGDCQFRTITPRLYKDEQV